MQAQGGRGRGWGPATSQPSGSARPLQRQQGQGSRWPQGSCLDCPGSRPCPEGPLPCSSSWLQRGFRTFLRAGQGDPTARPSGRVTRCRLGPRACTANHHLAEGMWVGAAHPGRVSTAAPAPSPSSRQRLKAQAPSPRLWSPYLVGLPGGHCSTPQGQGVGCALMQKGACTALPLDCAASCAQDSLRWLRAKRHGADLALRAEGSSGPRAAAPGLGPKPQRATSGQCR